MDAARGRRRAPALGDEPRRRRHLGHDVRGALRETRAALNRLEIFTVGHSDRTLAALVGVLRAHDVLQVADVRRFRASKRHPHFAGAVLAAELPRAGLAYRHFEPLGGMREPRPDSAHRTLAERAFRGYADHMESPAFATALDVLRAWSAAAPTAVLCAERLPEHCHRSLLADALDARGVCVTHLLDGTTRRAHVRDPRTVVEAGRLVYRGAQESLDL